VCEEWLRSAKWSISMAVAELSRYRDILGASTTASDLILGLCQIRGILGEDAWFRRQ